jgi:hypothetical protein
MQSGEAITITLQLDPGTGSAPQLVFADRATTRTRSATEPVTASPCRT